MNRFMKTALLLTCGLALVGWGVFQFNTGTSQAEAAESAAARNEPSSDYESIAILEVIPFKLEQEMIHYWRKEQPKFNRGALMILEANADWLRKRQAAQPVLFFGGETLQVLNDGGNSGRALVILPFANSEDVDSLVGRAVFFGSPEIPERITKKQAGLQAETALNNGASTLSAAQLKQVRKDSVTVANESDLYRVAGTLLERHSPGETECISWLKGAN